jgi:nucleotide-binding universal stress UspA family protein
MENETTSAGPLYRKILVPLDGSGLAEVALRHAESLAWQCGAEIILMRVIHMAWPLSAPDMNVERRLDVDRIQAAALTYLKGICGELRAKKITAHKVVMNGPVADTIVDYARQEGVDLIVMCSHGGGGFSRWVFGSVAEKVLQGAPCPVLLVRAREGVVERAVDRPTGA